MTNTTQQARRAWEALTDAQRDLLTDKAERDTRFYREIFGYRGQEAETLAGQWLAYGLSPIYGEAVAQEIAGFAMADAVLLLSL